MAMNGQATVMERAVAPDTSALQEQIQQLQAQVDALRAQLPDNRLSMVVFSGDLDRVLAAFVIASGAAASGMEVSMFFTFWGLTALRQKRVSRGKTLFQKMMGWMTPVGTRGLGVSKMNFGGIGAKMLRAMMRQQGVPQIEEMAQMARDLGVRIVACQMSMDVMGLHKEELIDGIEVGGVATFLGDATRSKATLFI
ncbi:MAG: DsrE/DsrF/DrsH-like family protein [Fimbriimonadales bacterium]|nr:DsrE/DsrF/DrsH-like family protein [Fimbriimonadales bacterium]